MTKSKTLELLSEFISIQSVSADSKRKKEMFKAMDFLKNHLEKLGFEIKLIKKGDAPPLLIGTYQTGIDRYLNGNNKTIGIYGHYDVQPEDPVNEWNTPPFKLTLKNGKLYGRGIADNKGHIIQNLASIKRLIEADKLKNNIVFVLEGEEEVGSAHFEDYAKEAKDILSKVDVFYVTDTGMYGKNIPQIFYGLRGLVYFELTVDVGIRDLHSGLWGNRVMNPALVLSQLFSKIKDEKTDKVLIKGFYDNVRTISEKERKLLSEVSKTDEQQLKESGVYRLISREKNQPYLSGKIYPSLDINGFISGYIGEGAKTVIPRKATVKFSCRLVENQTPLEIIGLIRFFIKNNLPAGVKFELKILSEDHPFYTQIDNPIVKKTAEILTTHFANKTLFNRTGGSIPSAEILQRLYKKPIILTGFTLSDSYIHSPNENFDEEMFWKGIEALQKIYSA